MIRSTLFAVALAAAAPALAQSGAAVTSVTRAKVAADAEAEFKRVDTNNNGQMSRAEIETFQVAIATTMLAARNKEAFAALDADKNGQLSAAEFAKLSAGTPKVDPGPVLSIDTNKDGQISLAEHRSAKLATFTRFDANKDGTLTAAEVEAAVAKK